MPKVQLADRSALILSVDVTYLIEHHQVGDFCFEYEKQHGPPARTNLVIYLMVPGAGRDPELVKLYMNRSETRWDEPGYVVAWDGNESEPTLIGVIETPHWCGVLVDGQLWTET